MSFILKYHCVCKHAAGGLGEIDGLGSFIEPLHPRKHFTKHTCKSLADAL